MGEMLGKLTFLFVTCLFNFVSSSSPCDNNIVMALDTSITVDTFNPDLFKKQNNLVKKLLTRPFFDNFERLALGNYNLYTNLTHFGDFHDESDVANYVDSLKQDSNNLVAAWLNIILPSIYNNSYWKVNNNPTTVIVFSSDVYEKNVHDAREHTKRLQDECVRVVFVAHTISNNTFHFDYNRLVNMTGDASLVFKWDMSRDLPDDDYQEWFKKVLGCGATPPTTTSCHTTSTTESPRSTITLTGNPVTTKTSELQPSTSCCNRIVVAIDNSKGNRYYNTVNQFLYTNVLSDDLWNNVDRLGIAWHSNRIDHLIPFHPLSNLQDIRTSIKQRSTVTGTLPHLPTVLQLLSNRFPSDSDAVHYIVFVAQPLTPKDVHSALSYAQQLQQNGRLSLVGLGKDANGSLLSQISPHQTIWTNPEQDSELPNWKPFFLAANASDDSIASNTPNDESVKS